MNEINHECYVSLEVAKLLKEAEFDWKTFGYYNKLGFFHRAVPHNGETAAPTLDVAQRWLREVKGFEVTIDWSVIVNANLVDFNERVYNYHVESDDYADGDNEFTSYEQAQEAGIKKALEIILEKGE